MGGAAVLWLLLVLMLMGSTPRLNRWETMSTKSLERRVRVVEHRCSRKRMQARARELAVLEQQLDQMHEELRWRHGCSTRQDMDKRLQRLLGTSVARHASQVHRA